MRKLEINTKHLVSTFFVFKKKNFLVFKDLGRKMSLYFMVSSKNAVKISPNYLLVGGNSIYYSWVSRVFNSFKSGIKKKILLLGLGYQAFANNNSLNFKIGYSHTILLSFRNEKVSISLFKCRRKNINILVFGYYMDNVCSITNKMKTLKKSNSYKEIGFFFKNSNKKLKKFKKK